MEFLIQNLGWIFLITMGLGLLRIVWAVIERNLNDK